MDDQKPRSVRPDAIVPAQGRELLPISFRRSLPAVAAGATTVGLAWAARQLARVIVRRAEQMAAAPRTDMEVQPETEQTVDTDSTPGDVIYRRVTIIEVRRVPRRD